MTMIENYKILVKFVKYISSETPDVDTYLFVKDNISNYSLGIDIKSKALKEKILQVETTLRYTDKNQNNNKKSFFEMIFATVIRLDENIKDKKDLGKIILCDLQNEIYPRVEKAFLEVLKVSGYKEIAIETKIDFDKLYKEKFN